MKSWQESITSIYQSKAWEEGINLLQNILANDSDNMYAYLVYNYFLMHVLVEEDYSAEQGERYQLLLKNSFNISYNKYKHVDCFLLFSGVIAYMSEWYLDLDIIEARKMLEEAYEEKPYEIINKWVYDTYVLARCDKQTLVLSQNIIKNNDLQQKLISNLCIVGDYILDLIHHWYERNVNNLA